MYSFIVFSLRNRRQMRRLYPTVTRLRSCTGWTNETHYYVLFDNGQRSEQVVRIVTVKLVKTGRPFLVRFPLIKYSWSVYARISTMHDRQIHIHGPAIVRRLSSWPDQILIKSTVNTFFVTFERTTINHRSVIEHCLSGA